MERNHSYSNDKKRWKHKHGKKNQNQNQQNQKEHTSEREAENDIPVQHIQLKSLNCAYCGNPIEEMASAMGSKEKGEPVHFDCVLNKIKETEKIAPDESVTYIGQGRFGIVHFDNPQDLRHFQIRRIIEWEERDNKMDWRQEISDTFSTIK